MRIIDRYLAKAVILGTLMTLAVILPLLGFFMLAEELDDIGRGSYEFKDALWVVALSLPRYAYEIFPIAALIGALVGLGNLAVRSELVAMRAAGVSIAGIIGGANLGGLLLAASALVLGEGIAPIAEQRALSLREIAKSGQDVQLTRTGGLWARDGEAFVNIRQIDHLNELRDIHIYRIDGTQLLSSTHAERARYRGDHWVLENIQTSLISEEAVRVQRIAESRWDSLINPDLLRVAVVGPEFLPLWGLKPYIDYMQDSGQDARRYQVIYWSRIAQPVLVLAMLLVAVPVVLSSSRSKGVGGKIFIGILIGILFYLTSRGLAYSALLYGVNPAIAAFAVPLIFATAALIWLRRVG